MTRKSSVGVAANSARDIQNPDGELRKRFMVMVKATKDSEAGKMPSEEVLSAIAKFNEEMAKAGVMLDGNGLQPSSKGARVRFSGDKRTVIDGLFAETKELVAGYWILRVKSKQEAIEWIKRCPNPHEEESEIEIRRCSSLRTSARARRSSSIASWASRCEEVGRHGRRPLPPPNNGPGSRHMTEPPGSEPQLQDCTWESDMWRT